MTIGYVMKYKETCRAAQWDNWLIQQQKDIGSSDTRTTWLLSLSLDINTYSSFFFPWWFHQEKNSICPLEEQGYKLQSFNTRNLWFICQSIPTQHVCQEDQIFWDVFKINEWNAIHQSFNSYKTLKSKKADIYKPVEMGEWSQWIGTESLKLHTWPWARS